MFCLAHKVVKELLIKPPFKVRWIFSMVKRFDREFSLLKKGREKHQRSMCLYTGQKEVLNLVPVYLTECLFTLRAGGARGKLGGTSG